MAEQDYALFDIDNCLANDAWRIPRIHWHEADPDLRYATYHALAPFDCAGNLHWARMAMRSGRKLIFSTARPESHRVPTAEWLQRALGCETDLLLMRAVGDHRPSVVLKREHLREFRDRGVPTNRILQAHDDRPDVVMMYKEHGIRAAVLSIHSVCAYSPPERRAAFID